MKSIIKGFMFTVIFILSLLIAMVIMQKYVVTTELNRIVSQAISETQRVISDQRYEISNNDEYLAEFSQSLVRLSSACNEFDIEVFGIDYERGLLDIKVSTDIHYMNGKEEKTSVRKTSVVDVQNEDIDLGGEGS